MDLEEISFQKRFLVSDGSAKCSNEMTPEDLLVGEKGTVSIANMPPIFSNTDVYEVNQSPYGDSFILGEDEIICLMLIVPPRVVKTDLFYVEGCTKTEYIKASYTSKESAFLAARDLLQLGDVLDLPVKTYYRSPVEWKRCFGGNFTPLDFRSKSKLERAFNPTDIVYISPSNIPKKYLNSSRGDREVMLRGFTDVYGTESSGGTITYQSDDPEILKSIRWIAKSLGRMIVGESPGTLIVRAIELAGVPSTGYPISVSYTGRFHLYTTPNRERVVLADGTISYW